MAPEAMTRTQTLVVYEKLTKRAAVIKMKDEMSFALVEVAKSVLDLNDISDAGAQSSLTIRMHETSEVTELMKNLLPSPVHVFNDKFFRAPLFPISLLKDVADLYEYAPIPDGLKSSLELSRQNLSDKGVMTHAWFSFFLGCDKDTIKASIHE